MRLHYFWLCLHLLGVVVWVGGMAFAHLCLRPAVQALAPAQRLPLFAAALKRFFNMVSVAVVAILVSGLAMMLEVGFAQAPKAWHMMFLTGLVMAGIYLSILLGPWPALRAAVAREDWAAGAMSLGRIRQRVAFNLGLGLLTVGLATIGLGF